MVPHSLPHARLRIAIALAAIFLLTDCAQPTSTRMDEPTRTGQPEISLPAGDVIAAASLRRTLEAGQEADRC